MHNADLIMPKALLKALGPAANGEDVGAIIVDLAAGGRIDGVADYIVDHRYIDGQPEHDQRIAQDQWQRVVHQAKVQEVWANGTVRLDSDVKNHLYFLEIVGIRFKEAPVRKALQQYGVMLASKRGNSTTVSAPASDATAEPVVVPAKGTPKSNDPIPSLDEVLGVGVRHAGMILDVCRSSIYARIKDGTLVRKKIGGKTLITSESIRALMQ